MENLPANQNFIIAANHNTWIDPVYFVSNLTKVIKKRIYFIAGSKKYFGLGIITINKKNKKKTVDKALSYLKRGRIIFLFVEGRSNPTKTLNKPKTGAARLALRSRQPVIPAGIIGTRGNSALGSLFWEFIWPKKVTLKIGRPLTFEKYYGRAETKEL